MRKKDFGLYFKFIRGLIRLVIPRFHFENMPPADAAVVYVSHHQNLLGPISILAWIKGYVRTWVLSVFATQAACYEHYTQFTFTKRYGWPKAIAKLIAWPASYLISWLIQSLHGIPVYRKSRDIITTLKQTVAALMDNESILIFAQVDYTNTAVDASAIYEGFLNLEKYYFRETEKHLTFVPLYSDKAKKVIRAGKPLQFTGKIKFIEERKEMAQKIEAELLRLAEL